MEEKIVFISGHGSLTFEEFIRHYQPAIDFYLVEGASFVIGDFRGADVLAQEYLKNKTGKVTIFHCFDKPRYRVDTYSLESKNWKYRSGFRSDDERDEAMTESSSHDLAWVREGREDSGTARNIRRRFRRIK